MMRDDFAVFILTHGRPDKVKTYKMLKKQGYTGKIYLVIDDEDKNGGQYLKRFGNEVIQFSKSDYDEIFDVGDNFEGRRGVIYARNASFKIASDLGLKYFLQLDDDYSSIVYKFDGDLEYKEKRAKNLDFVFSCMIDFHESTKMKTVAFLQNGDFIGGKKSNNGASPRTVRKVMNAFFCCVEKPFTFNGRINEDVNLYTQSQRAGDAFLSISNVSVIQTVTQSNPGGMTELYLDQGTYVKSFYSVMYCPSAVIVKDMGDNHRRLHHAVSFNACAPKIIEERHRRRSNATG